MILSVVSAASLALADAAKTSTCPSANIALERRIAIRTLAGDWQLLTRQDRLWRKDDDIERLRKSLAIAEKTIPIQESDNNSFERATDPTLLRVSTKDTVAIAELRKENDALKAKVRPQ